MCPHKTTTYTCTCNNSIVQSYECTMYMYMYVVYAPTKLSSDGPCLSCLLLCYMYTCHMYIKYTSTCTCTCIQLQYSQVIGDSENRQQFQCLQGDNVHAI